MSNKFNFNIYGNSTQTDEQRRNFRADILDFNANFEKINELAAMISDLPIVANITIAVSSWNKVGSYWETTISNDAIKAEPYIIEVFFDNLTIIKSPINPKPNSQADGSIKLITTIKPSQSLTAKLIVTKGVSVE